MGWLTPLCVKPPRRWLLSYTGASTSGSASHSLHFDELQTNPCLFHGLQCTSVSKSRSIFFWIIGLFFNLAVTLRCVKKKHVVPPTGLERKVSARQSHEEPVRKSVAETGTGEKQLSHPHSSSCAHYSPLLYREPEPTGFTPYTHRGSRYTFIKEWWQFGCVVHHRIQTDISVWIIQQLFSKVELTNESCRDDLMLPEIQFIASFDYNWLTSECHLKIYSRGPL